MTSVSSSPPARGSSRDRYQRQHGEHVVPARAGIFPSRRSAAWCCSGRPRPRGDLPPANVLLAIEQGSSPPARGSSSLDLHARVGEIVVPARAGIFPVDTTSSQASICRPRPRGDLPYVLTGSTTSVASSPPARGSSDRGVLPDVGRGVVPARAGIFPGPGHSSSLEGCRPRPRGDLPWGARLGEQPGVSSPPARGSSSVTAGQDAAQGVVPARAGIFRCRPVFHLRVCRRPRPRGDLPPAPRRSAASMTSSPPARGSSWIERKTRIRTRVVPARAGIFPLTTRIPALSARRPRPRGDLPGTVNGTGVDRLSSPPARGSSILVVKGAMMAWVVPARAGIFPYDATIIACGSLSSPPARGSSRSRLRRTPRSRVVPARAGIFPAPGWRWHGGPCRPRPRGDLPYQSLLHRK